VTTEEGSFEVALEGMAYALIEVHRGHDERFEDWYENDHFYAGGVLAPYVLSGRRWYASRTLRENRFIGAGCRLPDPSAGTNLATYFLTVGGLTNFYGWINPELSRLRCVDRMFAERTHVNTGAYAFEGVLGFPGNSGVPAHVALDHPFPGLFVTYLDVRPHLDADPNATLPDGTLALSFRPNPELATMESMNVTAGHPGLSFATPSGEPVRMVLAFLTEPPVASWEWAADLAGRVGRLTGSTVLWGGALEPVVPGSRAHLAKLR
jgi:hypothetical protein